MKSGVTLEQINRILCAVSRCRILLYIGKSVPTVEVFIDGTRLPLLLPVVI